jgi:O-antigen/teichoic acid export membrane protein
MKDGEPVEAGLIGRVVSGARWVVVLRVGGIAVIWGTSVALARLLVPSQYGLAGMAMVLVSILTIFQESGLHAALIQRQERIQEAVDTATAYTPVVGLLLCAVCLGLAPLAGLFFHHHEVTNLVRGLSVVFLLRAISQVPITLLQKELRFRAFAIVTLTGNLAQMAVAIVLASRGAGAWSAIGGLIAFEAWCALFMWPLCPMRPHPRRASLKVLRELLRYGRNIVGVNAAGMIYAYLDIVVVGRFLGAPSLGAYTIGYQSGKQAVATVTWSSNQLIFPVYSKLQNDLDRFRSAYLRSLRFITIVSVPIGLGLAAVSGEYIRVVYGSRWTAAIPVLAIMSILGLVLSVTATMGEVLKATGRPGLFFRVALLQGVLVAISVLSFYRFGIAAVAGCIAVSVTITGIVVTRRIAAILRIPRADWARTLLPPMIAGAIMVAGIEATRLAVGSVTSTATAPMLAALILVGGALYFASLRLVARGRVDEFMHEVGRFTALSGLRQSFRAHDKPAAAVVGAERSHDT